MSFLILIIGFALLIKGADVFVEGASSIAKKFNVPSMIIGLTIVAMGTSAPEAAVSITSSLAGQNDMSVANVVGSNFFNILVVLGVSSIIAKLPVQKETIKKDTPFLILVSGLLLIFGINFKLGRIEGIALLALFTYFLVNTIKSAKMATDSTSSETGETAIAIETESSSQISLPKTILISLVGIVGIVVGGDMVVNSATSIVAIKKGETEIAIGNVIGSNLFNILLVLGLAATINPIAMSMSAFIDIVFMVLITLLLYMFMKKDNSLVKKQGIILVVLYIAYMAYTIMR